MDILVELFWIFLKVNLLSTSGPASVGLLYHEVVGDLVTEELNPAAIDDHHPLEDIFAQAVELFKKSRVQSIQPRNSKRCR